MKEASEILEVLASQNLLDDFFQAIDDDNLPAIRRLLATVEIDVQDINRLIEEIVEAAQ